MYEISIGRINPTCIISLLKAGEYLQSDLIIKSVCSYFREIHNARIIVKCDKDFSRNEVTMEQLIKILPVSIEATYVKNSPWKDIFLHWLNNVSESVV